MAGMRQTNESCTHLLSTVNMEDCTPLLLPLINALQSPAQEDVNGKSTLELEARLGRYDTSTGRFEAGLYPLYFQTLVSALDGCKAWERVTDWEESVDTFYTLPDGQTARTSTSRTGAVSVTKSRLASQQLLCMGTMAATNSQSGLDVRLSLSRETVLDPPFTVCPTQVRIKQRRTYMAVNWRFDLSRTWSGASRWK